MFTSVYLRLTAWYVLLIMAISIIFSVWIFNQATSELRAGLVAQVASQQRLLGVSSISSAQFEDIIETQYHASQQRLLGTLMSFNGGVLIVGAVASYGLARRTMRPIAQALEAQKRFTADASHELRTPLAAMRTEIEVALRDTKRTAHDVTSLLKSNLEETERLSGLAESLLTLARSDDPPALVAISLRDQLQAVVKRLQPLALAKNIAVVIDSPLLRVMAQPDTLQRIVAIIIDNAIKYGPKKSRILITARRQHHHAVITITDEGPGIADSDLPHIFERFYRADAARSAAHTGGHGLGLAIAYKLLAQMRGTIKVESTVGQGSSFSVTLPLAPGAA